MSLTVGRALGTTLAVAALLPTSAFAQTADLSITKDDNRDPFTVGGEFSYILTIANAGPDRATTVEVVDSLPNEVDFLDATPSQGQCALQGPNRVECSLLDLASGASVTVFIRVRASRDGEATNTATVSGTPADPNPGNNEDTEVTRVRQPEPARCKGRIADIVGTPRSDFLTGTPQRDVIAGLGGSDIISGLDGNDVLCGGRAPDALRSGPGDDLIGAGGGDDLLRGQEGDDNLAGNRGNDNLGGGHGNDVLKGGAGTDECLGRAEIERGCE